MPTVRTDNRIPRVLAFAGCTLATATITGAAVATATPSGHTATAIPKSWLAAKPVFARSPAPAPVRSPQELMSGDRGAAVKQLQRTLRINVNGVFGGTTREAVARFQRTHRLHADGVVGPQTRRALHLRVRVVPTPSSGSGTGTGTPTEAQGSSSASGGYSIPAGIVMCESGGNYSAVNSSSGAGGAYQILPSTWAAYGGTGLPQDAPAAEQNAIAAKIYASGGAGQWSC
jgi:peptidoglycan hydrolase-like protein with peptidoglycan-binding domain